MFNNISDDVQTALIWIRDVESGDIIETRGYTDSCLSFDHDVSDNYMKDICTIVNSVLALEGSNYRVNHGKGELRPVTDIERIGIINEELANDLIDLKLDISMELYKKEKGK